MASRGSNGPYSSSGSEITQVAPSALTNAELQQQQLIQQALAQQRNVKQAMMAGDETIFHFPGQGKGNTREEGKPNQQTCCYMC